MERGLFFSLLLLIFSPLWAQQPQSSSDEQISYIGMTLSDLIERFGTPSAAIASRGNEYWQDDVVFQYAHGDFYIHKDRVWKVKCTSMYGISNRDRKAAVLLVLGNTAEDRGDYVLSPVSGRNWPLMLRVNFTNAGLVSAIYLYRPDF